MGREEANNPNVLELGVDARAGVDSLWSDEAPKKGREKKDGTVGTSEWAAASGWQTLFRLEIAQ